MEARQNWGGSCTYEGGPPRQGVGWLSILNYRREPERGGGISKQKGVQKNKERGFKERISGLERIKTTAFIGRKEAILGVGRKKRPERKGYEKRRLPAGSKLSITKERFQTVRGVRQKERQKP